MPSYYDLKMPGLRIPFSTDLWPPGEIERHQQALDRVSKQQTLTAGYPRCHLVTSLSSREHRRGVEPLARCFLRELHYDFMQYSAEPHDPDGRTYLWTSPGQRGEENTVIGACCFGWRGDEPGRAPHWGMAWVWFHLYERRRRHLSWAWPYFRAHFGAFDAERPPSLAMAAFLRKR
jgi:hypothetical protein